MHLFGLSDKKLYRASKSHKKKDDLDTIQLIISLQIAIFKNQRLTDIIE